MIPIDLHPAPSGETVQRLRLADPIGSAIDDDVIDKAIHRAWEI
ncbi:hypothetical protein [Nocardia flavorosea]|nr:hypothetical protein [Nocardia flavorosea]